jgi:hypothetical protein
VGELESRSSILGRHGGEVPVLKCSSIIVVLEMHSHLLGSMFIIIVVVDNTALRRKIVGSHLARLCEMYGGG